MSEIKFNNLELRKDIRAIVPNIDDSQLDLIEISVIHLVDVYVKAKFNQQQEIEKLTRIAAEADEGCEYWRDKYKQAQAKAEYYEMKYENTGAIFNRRHMLDKIERYENAIKECIERMNEGGPGTRSFIYEKLKEVMEGTECMGK